MKCPKCSKVNSEGSKFCNECGASIAPVEQVTEQSVNKPEHQVEGERKQATVLFSDLSGYTAMTENMDPEEVKNLMGDIFAKAGRIVEKYQGTVERFFGDEIMILFGVPKAHEDDPVRAIHTAIAIHKLVDKLSLDFEKKYKAKLSMHTGINSGLVITGDEYIGKGRHGLTGDTINLAKRLTGLAEPGEIIVGENTYQKIEQQFNCKECDPVKVKGKTEPVKTYKVEGKLKQSQNLKTGFNRQVFSELVGRDKELNKLALHVAQAIDGKGSVVNIIGEAGIGKSRLFAEFSKLDVVSNVILLEGKAISIGRALPFYPFVDFLKNWAAIEEDDNERIALTKLESLVKSIDKESVNEIVPFVATMMGMKLSKQHKKRTEGITGEPLEKLIFKNLRDLLIKAADKKPLVVVIEDLHWADKSSIEFLKLLFNITKEYNILFVNIFRPGFEDTGDRISKSVQKNKTLNFEEILLKALDSNTCELMVNNMLKIEGLSHEIKHKIIDRTGGNPFFIEEVVRSFIDEGAIVLKDNEFILTDKINDINVPYTIADLLTARIDRLEDKTRELIKIASVIGRNFFDKILKQVANTIIDDIDTRLGYLKDVQLIREKEQVEELEYLFKHALVQEVAYKSLLHEKRRQIHLNVANSIEAIFKERLHEFYGTLSYHYINADNPDKAEEYMIKAGEEAMKSSASNEALYYLQKALKSYLAKYGNDAESDKLINLEKNIAIAFYNKAQWANAIKYFDKVLERYGMPVPKMRLSGIATGIWSLLILLKVIYLKLPNSKKIPDSRDNEAFDLYHKAGEAFIFADPPRMLLGALNLFRHTTRFDLFQISNISTFWSEIACCCLVSGIFPFRFSNRIFKLSQSYVTVDDIKGRMANVVAGCVFHNFQGSWGEIKGLDDDLMNSSFRIGEFYKALIYLWWYGQIKVEQGEFDHYSKAMDKLYEIAETFDNSHAIGNARALKTNFSLMIRNAHEAQSEAIRVTSNIRWSPLAIMWWGYRAEAQQLTGDTDGAQDSILQAMKYLKKQRLILPYFFAPFLAARFFIDIEQLKQAISCKTSLNTAYLQKQAYKSGKAALRNSRNYAPCRTKILRLMGIYFWLIGKQSKALKWWAKSIKTGELLGARPDLSRTYFEVGKSLLSPQSKYKELNGITAREYLEKAKTMFEEMDLAWDLNEFKKNVLI